MAKPSKGAKHKSRNAFMNKPSYRPTITKFLRQYSEGQQVVVMQEPSSRSGMPYKRFRGRSGYVVGKRGKAYIVEIQEGNKTKKVISKPEHLKAI